MRDPLVAAASDSPAASIDEGQLATDDGSATSLSCFAKQQLSCLENGQEDHLKALDYKGKVPTEEGGPINTGLVSILAVVDSRL